MQNQYPDHRLLGVGADKYVVTHLEERVICFLHARASKERRGRLRPPSTAR